MGRFTVCFLLTGFSFLLSFVTAVRRLPEFPLIRPVPCSNRMTGESGVCTFNWSCAHVAHGVHLGPCVDRFFIGSCCKIPEDSDYATGQFAPSNEGIEQTTKESHQVESVDPHSLVVAATDPKQETSLPAISSHSNKKEGLIRETFQNAHNSLDPVPMHHSSHNSVPSLQPNVTNSLVDPPTMSQNNTATFTTSHRETSFEQRKPVVQDTSHNQRKPVVLEETFHQWHTVFQEQSHDERKPILMEPSHDLKKPVALETTHDQRRPLFSDDSHNLRWPMLNFQPWNEPDHRTTIENRNLSRPSDKDDILRNTSKSSFSDHLSKNPTASKPSHNALINNHQTTTNFFHYQHITRSTSISPEEKITTVPSVTSNFSNFLIGNEETNFALLNFTSFSGPPYPWPSPKPSTNVSQGIILRDVSKVCGRSRTRPMARIVGGRKSPSLRWPWMISLRRYEGKSFKHKCGATLLNQLWAITAAHCVDGKRPSDVMLRLGEYNFHRMDEAHPHSERRILTITLHPEFDSLTYENDLALLRFYEPVRLQANILPICLPKLKGDIAGRMAVVTGWGRLSEEGELPGSLHEVRMPILTNKECEDMYSAAGYSETIRDVFVCAGLLNGGLDACEGDSGGPMVVRGNRGQWMLVGLISWGMGCAAPKQPGVYTRITKFVDWIEETVRL